MVAQSHATQPITVEQWRDLQRASHDLKHEYVDGQLYAMAGGSLNHSAIAINVVVALSVALAHGPCRVYNSDAAVRLSARRYVYPDATVTCAEDDRGGVTEVRAPRVIVEILSEATANYDRGAKFGLYRACPHVREYVLIDTARQAVDLFRRPGPGEREWTYQPFGPCDVVSLRSIAAHLPVTALYARTDVPAPADLDGELE